MSLPLARAAAVGACFLLVSGCKFLDPTSAIDLDTEFIPDIGISFPEGAFIGPSGDLVFGDKLGEECASAATCRDGLTCGASGTCEATGETPNGGPCVVSSECVDGSTCGMPTECWDNARSSNPPGNPLDCGLAVCVTSGGAGEGQGCVQPGDCAAELRCNLIGLTGACQPEGNTDAGEPCETHSDCADPLMCAPPSPLTGSDDFTCQIPAAVAEELFLPPVECEPPSPDEAFGVHFEVPRSEPLADFFRLPFPNDIRRTGTGLDLSGFHDPGAIYIGGEIVSEALLAAEEREGFSNNPTVFFRFTQNPDFASIRGGEDATLFFVNIDPDSPNYGAAQGMSWSVSTGGGTFICPRYAAIRVPWNTPLEHDTTYAVYLTTGIRGPDGEQPAIPDDFTALLADTEPSGQELGAAWDAYAPLRDYLADQEVDPTTLAAAAVFTTQDADGLLPALRRAARSGAAPTLENITVCDDGVRSPCEDGERGTCSAENDAFWEIHATYEAPVIQTGTRPYLSASDGGTVELNGGDISTDGRESICVAITVPKADMPEGGWPVVMFGHGTGGSYTSHVTGGTAAAFAGAENSEGTPTPIATIGIDGPMHGHRKGDTELDSDLLFYNFANPAAAVGNVYQGAADFFTLTRLLEGASFSATAVGEVRFDTGQFGFLGHSQGATTGALFVPYEPQVAAVVFSGQGGGFILSLLNKTSPHDVAGGVDYVLTRGGSTGGSVSEADPVLSLLQMIVDPVDPLNYARLYFREPVDPERGGTDILQTYGFGDTYSPEPTQAAFARATRLAIPDGAPGDLSGFDAVVYPVSGNRGSGEETVTAVLLPHDPGGAYDGHFVLFREAALMRQAVGFFVSRFTTGEAVVEAP